MYCPRCGRTPMDLGLLAGPEPRELVFLCETCGHICTLHGLPWAMESDACPRDSDGPLVQYDEMGELECGRCGGPMRAAEFEQENDLALCQWCGQSQRRPLARARHGSGMHELLQSWASLTLAPLVLCQSALTHFSRVSEQPRC